MPLLVGALDILSSRICLKFEGFVKKVNKCWMPYIFQGSLSFISACKLKALKIDLKKWNEEVFGNVVKRKKVLMDELRDLDVIVEERSFFDVERLGKAEIIGDFEKTILYEEVS
jgi:hypothetical protein